MPSHKIPTKRFLLSARQHDKPADKFSVSQPFGNISEKKGTILDTQWREIFSENIIAKGSLASSKSRRKDNTADKLA